MILIDGKKAAADYVKGTRMAIQNDRPIIGVYEVNQEGSTDMYYKGANILHTLRQLINDDEKWRKILRGLNMVFYHQTVSSKQIEEYISKESGINLTKFWDQYLRTVQIPTLEYKKSEYLLSYRYTNMIENFHMPMIAIINGEEKWIYPSDSWKTDTYADEIKILKIKDASMASAEEVKNITGYSIGGVSPIGHLKKVNIFIDNSLERFTYLFAAAGHPNCVFKIKFKDLHKITNGSIKEIIE